MCDAFDAAYRATVGQYEIRREWATYDEIINYRPYMMVVIHGTIDQSTAAGDGVQSGLGSSHAPG